ncbi:amidohydrolase family protein [Archaeoglobus neptunius]|uniref:amidohydrolase family protein n=1 Tax=Archaeoglobus neptunius TaxID=2798580 RepID=UPI001925C9E6|nr:amidohydrolase family protein [Archaeoglobus neptunius]
MFRGILITPEYEKFGELIPEEMIFEETRTDKASYIITPTFFNAHTHLGDAALRETPRKPLEEIVGPGGYKHRMLEGTDVEKLREHAVLEVEASRKAGTSHFLDFREGGVRGLDVTRGLDGVLTLARPSSVEEAESIGAFGFAYSSTRDHDAKLVEEVREVARRKKMVFGIHAGERDCEDVDSAIALDPDFVVHMNMCPERIQSLIDAEIPIVSCLRSNAFFGLLNTRSYEILQDYDGWMLGTDNAMTSTSSILDEMHFAAYILENDKSIFRAAVRGYELFGVESGYIIFNRRYSFKRTSNFISTLVRRAGIYDIETVLIKK